MSISIAWFRRDLRLSHNPMLRAAVDAGDEVVPVFVVDPAFWGPAGRNRRHFLAGCLRSLDERLDGRLVVRNGDASEEILRLAGEVGATEVHCAADFGVAGRRRDDEVAAALEDAGAALVRTGSPYAVPPDTLTTNSGTPFKVFTPFSKAWRHHGWELPIPAPRSLRVPDGVDSDGLPDAPEVDATLPDPGEAAAKTALDRFLTADIDDYDRARDLPGDDRTSRLSPYLHFGCIHPRQILSRIDQRAKGHRVFATELAWRDFYADVLFHAPESAWSSWNPDMAAMEVDTGRRADERFDAWCEGRTGVPIVDAGMRQLLAEGWMHNRVRMITASYLVKDLHLDWTRGARHFMEHLVDGDLASNNHGWQWVAGTGTDAAPYFRVFNPVTQATRFDPGGAYVRRWVPELEPLADRHVHEPSASPNGVPLGYCDPIVDHAAERTEALRRYDAVRASSR
ncbi:MAG: deoxyribodipyrimidine photo-lyase [Acidimicrobiia bacterium]|nr:deoxyribodipyrimidine photo-lyase [Acidimicrobiia bacterium]